MGIEKFAEKIAELLTERLGDGHRVKAVEVLKNNGVVWHGVNILEEGRKICPCVYVDGYYEGYENGGLQMDDIVEDIIEDSRGGVGENFDRTLFDEYGKACLLLKGKLVNTEKNSEMLKDMPHREFMDLSLIYYVEISMNSKGVGHILVKNEHMEKWGKSEGELYLAVMENMERGGDGVVRKLMDLVAQIMGVEEMPDEIGGEGVELYVLTNQKRANGAVWMMDKNLLREAFHRIGKDFLILPSSVHEVLLAPVEEENYEDWLAKIAWMVREVNDTQLEETEILSYHVYRYYADREEVAIAA